MLNEQDYTLTVLRSPEKGSLSTVTRWEPKEGVDNQNVYYVKYNPLDQISFIDREYKFLLYASDRNLPTPNICMVYDDKLTIEHAGDTFEDISNIGVSIKGVDKVVSLLNYTPLLLEIMKGTLQSLLAFHIKGFIHVDFKIDNICMNVSPLVSSIKNKGDKIKIVPSDITLIDFSFSILDKFPLKILPPIDANSDKSSYLAPDLIEILNSDASDKIKIELLQSKLDYGTDLFGLSYLLSMLISSPSNNESIKITAAKYGIDDLFLLGLIKELESYTGANKSKNWKEAVNTQNPDLLPHGNWIKKIDEQLKKAQENGYELKQSYTFEYKQMLHQVNSIPTQIKPSLITPPIPPKEKPTFLKKKKDSTVIYSDKKELPKRKAFKFPNKLVLSVIGLALLVIFGYSFKDLMPNNIVDIVADKIEPISQGQVKSKPQAIITPQIKVDQAQIDNLLRLAQEDLKNIRLTHPPENNAFIKFSHILDLDKNNTQAKKGFIQIIAKYLHLVEERLNQNKLTQAQKYITKAKFIRQQYNQRGYDKNEFYGVTTDTSLSNIEKQEQKIANAIGQINDQKQLDREIRQLVSNIQQELKRLKYPKLLINGSQNKATIKAIRAYQKAKGLSQNGYVSAALYEKLQAEKAWPEQKTTQQAIEQPLQQSEPIQTVVELPQCTNCPEMVNIPGTNIAMSATEITYNQWQACIDDKGCSYKPPDKFAWGKGNRPVVFVNWDDTQQYIKWLSHKTNQSYRLPTEAEWQYAAKGGVNTQFPWGNKVGENNANCAYCKSQWDNEKTAPVKSFAPNSYGLYDMTGNVWEWSNSCFSPDYLPECTIKGGAYDATPEQIKPMYINDDLEIRKNTRASNIGFRVVKQK